MPQRSTTAVAAAAAAATPLGFRLRSWPPVSRSSSSTRLKIQDWRQGGGGGQGGEDGVGGGVEG